MTNLEKCLRDLFHGLQNDDAWPCLRPAQRNELAAGFRYFQERVNKNAERIKKARDKTAAHIDAAG